MSGIAAQAGLTAGNKNAGNGLYIPDGAGGSVVRWSVSTAQTATNTLANIDKAIQAVDTKRAELGALQNRMESTIRNQASISENEADARSRIRDTDFAEETAALTANNIIQQASQTVLAQANQRPTIADFLTRSVKYRICLTNYFKAGLVPAFLLPERKRLRQSRRYRADEAP